MTTCQFLHDLGCQHGHAGLPLDEDLARQSQAYVDGWDAGDSDGLELDQEWRDAEAGRQRPLGLPR